MGKRSCPADRESSKRVGAEVSGNRQRMSRCSGGKVLPDVDGLAAIHQNAASDRGALKLSRMRSPFNTPDEMPLWVETEFTFLRLGFADVLNYVNKKKNEKQQPKNVKYAKLKKEDERKNNAPFSAYSGDDEAFLFGKEMWIKITFPGKERPERLKFFPSFLPFFLSHNKQVLRGPALAAPRRQFATLSAAWMLAPQTSVACCFTGEKKRTQTHREIGPDDSRPGRLLPRQ